MVQAGGGGVLSFEPEPLYRAGTSISDLKGNASGAANKFLSAVSDGAAAVHHPGLSRALADFHSTWSKPARQLGTDVDAVGNNVCSATTIGVSADEQAGADTKPAAASAAANSSKLRRPIHAE